MNTITRCPACRTAFRVHRHQLEARGGQVRCGACGTVFDARATLEVLDEVVAEAGDSAPEPEPFETLDLDLSQPVSTTNPAKIAGATPSQAVPPAAGVSPPAETSAGSAALDEFEDSTLPPPSELPVFAEPPSLAEATGSADDTDVLDFGAGRRAARNRAILWAIAAVAMALLLAAQVAYFFRAEIAAIQPQARPWLAAACERLGCEVGLPRHADLLTVESANLEAESGNVLTLYATLRNRADFDQALPAIELTLTDVREQAVARRLLAPRDYFSGKDPRIAAHGEMAIRVSFEAVGVKASGYRLEALYTP